MKRSVINTEMSNTMKGIMLEAWQFIRRNGYSKSEALHITEKARLLTDKTIKEMGLKNIRLANCEYSKIKFHISLKDGMLLIEFFAKGECGDEKLDVLDGTNEKTIAYNPNRTLMDNIREAYYEATNDIDEFVEFNTETDDNEEFLRTPKYLRPCIP